MVNTQYLESKIKDSGKKKTYLAEKAGCSITYFRKKCAGEVDFKINEVSVLCTELGITTLTEKEKIFFA